MRPNLNDPEERRRYRAELIGLKRGWRAAGVLLCCIGAGLLVYGRFEEAPTPWLRTAAAVAVALGFAIFAYVIVYRTRYHKARMAEDQAI